MYYDGPARLETDRFVNFKTDITEFLDTTDAAALSAFATANKIPFDPNGSTRIQQSPFVYEGDAAFGWFQSNANAYPPTQYSERMTFENTDLRHQVYTQEVGQGPFRDGDKGTVILDRDWTLSDYLVVDAAGKPVAGKFPISLNNLPFEGVADTNGSGNPQPWDSVDECQSEGGQNLPLDARPSALMSAQDYATLEVNALTPSPPAPCKNCNRLVFEKDQIDYPKVQQYDVALNVATLELATCSAKHSCQALEGRNATGSYEPKVINGLGYTIQANTGLPAFLDLGFVDAEATHGIRSRQVTDASISAGQRALSSISAKFTTDDINAEVAVTGAGPAGTKLAAVIIAVSGDTATLNVSAGTSISDAAAMITNAFRIRLGLCYKTQKGTLPAGFTVKRGRKAWGFLQVPSALLPA